MPRTARDAKYGFGGKKKYSKSNTAESTNDFRVGPTVAPGVANPNRRVAKLGSDPNRNQGPRRGREKLVGPSLS